LYSEKHTNQQAKKQSFICLFLFDVVSYKKICKEVFMLHKVHLFSLFMILFLAVGCIQTEPLPESIVILGETTVEVGSSVTLAANVLPSGVNQGVVWSSSNDEIASVSQLGVVEAHQAGQVEIKATSVVVETVEAVHTITVTQEEDDTEYLYYHTKILSLDRFRTTIELLGVPYRTFSFETQIRRYKNGEYFTATVNDLYIGMENIYVRVNPETQTIDRILIDGETGFSNIRVAIRNSISDISQPATLYHDEVRFYLNGNTTLRTYDHVEQVSLGANTLVTMTVSSGRISVSVGGSVVLETNKRIIFTQASNSTIEFRSISRSLGTPRYEGSLEISVVNNRMLVVNDVNLEHYLTKVVPSEMPASFHAEALKSQAIAARTYAYMDIMRRNNEHHGFVVDDSISSQVYNNQNTHVNTTAAVFATIGIVMMHDGTPIQTYYYSTSSGLTGHAHEIWITTGAISPIPYLIGQNLAKDTFGNPIEVDPTSEASMLNFFKMIEMDTPDTGSPHHRWKVEFTYAQLTNTINTNLRLRYQATPASVLTKVGSSWSSQAIPASIGTVTDIYVGERGSSGVVMSLIIETTTGTYKVINQYNIRFTVRPQDSGSTVTRMAARNTDTTYTSSHNNDSILLSGFFALEKTANTVTFYGGGNGHGVGMSQYGAHGLGLRGVKYDQILETYYSAADLVDISFLYFPIDSYQTLIDAF
jgi:SpoIID/LytB domain protein